MILHGAKRPPAANQRWRLVPDAQPEPQIAAVSHQGRVFSFATSGIPGDTSVRYRVLQLRVDSPGDEHDWSVEQVLSFPQELRPAGMDLLTVPVQEQVTGTFASGVGGHLTAASDGSYLYLFRRSTRNTVWATRFVAVPDPGGDGDPTVWSLVPAPEARFQRSGSKDVPDGPTDVPSAQAADGTFFSEPIVELPMVDSSGRGRFTVVLTPAAEPGRDRWQIFAQRTTATGDRIDVFSLPRSDTGWFDLSERAHDERDLVAPDASFWVRLRGDDGVERPVSCATGLAATLYYRQEPAVGADGSRVQVNRSARVLLCFGVLAGDGETAPRTATLDFSLAADGSLSEVGTDRIVLSSIDPADQVLVLPSGDARVTLEHGSMPLTGLDGSFTLEAWIRPRDPIATGLVMSATSDRADVPFGPYLEVTQEGELRSGFGSIEPEPTKCRVETDPGHIHTGQWQHVAATFDGETGGYVLYVNGLEVAAANFHQHRPPEAYVQAIGKAGLAPGLVGQIDEVRAWSFARPAEDLREAMYRELPVDMHHRLAGYWRFDTFEAVDTPDGMRYTTPDVSGRGATGTVTGAVAQRSTSPVLTLHPEALLPDPRGLFTGVGVLDPRIRVGAGSTPCLLTGSDGRLHLYFRTGEDEFDVALYDTANTRAVFGADWRTGTGTGTGSGTGDSGTMLHVARRSGTLMNRAAVIISATPGHEDLCDVGFQTDLGDGESWSGVPRELSAYLAVLSGAAVGNPEHPDLASGRARFYDYAGAYPASRLRAGSGAVAVISRRPDPAGAVPGGAPLREVAVEPDPGRPDGASPTGTVVLTFQPTGATHPVVQTWPGVPLSPQAFCDTLNGRNPEYDYRQRGPADSIFAAVPTASASYVLLLVTDPDVAAMEVTVGPAAPADPDRCSVRMSAERSAGRAAGGPDRHGELYWPSVPRDQNEFVRFLSTEADESGSRLPTYAALITDGLRARVVNSPPQQSPDDVPTGLRVGSALVTATVDGATDPVDKQVTAAALPQQASAQRPGVELSGGSALFAVAPASRPVGGDLAQVVDTERATLREPGAVGGWLTEPERYGIEVSGTGAVVDTGQPSAEALRITGDLTLEAWVHPAGTAAGTGAPGTPANLLYAHFPATPAGQQDDPVTYRLGTSRLPALRLYYNATPPDQSTKQRTTLRIFGSDDQIGGRDAFTVQFWMRPDLSRMKAWWEYVWQLDSAAGDASWMTRMALYPSGLLTIQIHDYDPTPAIIEAERWLESNQWVHVSLVGDATRLSLYLDGKLSGQARGITMPSGHGRRLTFGGDYLTEGLEALVNSVQIFDRALTSAEVEIAATTGLGVGTPGLTIDWPLTEGAGTVAHNRAITGPPLDGVITALDGGLPDWDGAGALRRVYAALGSRVVGVAAPALTDDWTHVAAVTQAGGALRLDGNSYASGEPDESLRFTDAMSVETWLRPQATSGAQGIAGQAGEDSAGWAWRLDLDERHRPVFTVALTEAAGNRLLFVPTTEPLAADRAYHLAATCDIESRAEEADSDDPVKRDAVVRVYLDGRRIAERLMKVGADAAINRSTAPLVLGAALPGSTPGTAVGGFRGDLSETRLWSLALPGARVARHARGLPVSDETGLAARWRFVDERGAVATDSVGSNHLRLTRTDLWTGFDPTARCDLYVNGQRLGTEVLTVADVGGVGEPDQLRVGGIRAANGTLAAPLAGQLDELRVWSTMRTQEQIRDTRFTTLSGTEPGLAGYWRFDTGSGATVEDESGRGNRLTLTGDGGAGPPRWVRSAAPLAPEAPLVRNALGGPVMAGTSRISGSPAVVDYADTQRDAYGDLVGVMKRCYLTGAPDGRVLPTTGFKVDDLELVRLGQVQTRPQLVGYVEGAPPVPSENLSQPYYANLGRSDYRAYINRSSVTLTEAEDVSYGFSGSTATGPDVQMEQKLVAGPGTEWWTNLIAVISKTFKLKALLGVQSKIEFSQSNETGRRYLGAVGRTVSDTMALSGDWEPADADGAYLNAAVGRRFLPDNLGYAQVKSLTADLVGWRLRGSGALVSTSIVPNPDIPVDVNLIIFPLNPGYVKQGTLDGWVGLVRDKETGSSYFRPLEAYALKRRAELTQARLKAYYGAFDPTAFDLTPSAKDVEGKLDRVPASGALPYDWERHVDAGTMANTYVWTSDGGLYQEQAENRAVRSEVYGGSYSLLGLAGIAGEAELTAGATFAAEGEFDALAGGHVQLRVEKSTETSTSFGVDVDVVGEDFLKAPVFEDGTLVGYTDQLVPGKVDAYRFMTFYLAPDSGNHRTFFDKVVDPEWLTYSSSPAAAALRQARAETNPTWRVLHRVTYVSRIAPALEPFPGLAEAPDVTPPANLSANARLVELVQDAVEARHPGTAQPTPAQIGEAIAALTDQRPGFADILPWWAAFTTAAGADPVVRRTLYELKMDLLSYMVNAYATPGAVH